jgi:hypothetical protein
MEMSQWNTLMCIINNALKIIRILKPYSHFPHNSALFQTVLISLYLHSDLRYHVMFHHHCGITALSIFFFFFLFFFVVVGFEVRALSVLARPALSLLLKPCLQPRYFQIQCWKCNLGLLGNTHTPQNRNSGRGKAIKIIFK